MNHQDKLVSRSSTVFKTLAIGALLSTGSAWAQGEGGQLEEIIVTAEFREANVQDTPLAITAVNAAMLDARSQTNIYQVAAQAPSVTLKPGGAAIGPAMVAFIRGVGQTDFNYALEPGVGVYIDDVYYPTLTGSLVDLLDLDRIEILRGPQGTLAGKNSIGGAIKMFSKAPNGDGGGSVETTYGSYNRIDVRGSGDFTILPDQLFARIAGVSKHRDGYVDRLDYACVHPNSNVPTFSVSKLSDCKVGTEGGQAYTAGRVSLRWLATDSVEINLNADLTNDDSEAIPSVLKRVNYALTGPGGATGPFVPPPVPALGGPVPGYPNARYPLVGFNGTYIMGVDGTPVYLSNAFVPYGPYRGDTEINDGFVNYGTYMDPNAYDPNTHQRYSPSAIRPQTTLDHWGISGTIDWEINDQFSVMSITSYRKYDSSFSQDEDRSPINSQFLLQNLEHEQISEEFRLNGSIFDGKLDFTTGAFWFDQDGTLEANVNLYYVQFNFIHGPDPTPSSNLAGFLHGTYHFTDDLNFSAGVRYSTDEKTYTHFRRNIDGSLPQDATPTNPATTCLGPPHNIANPSNCALVGLYNQGATWSDSRFDWRVALDYRWNEDFMTYGQISTGYKGGGVNPRPFILAQLLPFESEVMTSYEIGLKSDLFNNTLRVNGAFFYNDYSDIIMTLNPCFAATPDPSDGPGPCALPINAGTADVYGVELEGEWHPSDASLIDVSMSYMDFDYSETVTPVTLTDVPPFSPEWKWSIGGQYTWEMGDLGSLTARIDANYQSDIYTGPLNTQYNRIDGYIMTNARLMWRSSDDNWDAALEITNLADEYYFYTLFDQYASGGGTLSGQPGQPRMAGITLRRHF
ncbi:MAG: TonB-dependent receptor-like protein [Gammaproteobacteria bacterium]|nr:TonB-dependent receptor-like protein [Gammaproteobacteria bacterium]